MPAQLQEITGVPAYVVTPESQTRGGLIVVHEVWGLTEHIQDVARRFAEQGYLVVAPDLLANTLTAGGIDPALVARAMNPETRDEAQKELRAVMAPINTPEFGKSTVEKLQQVASWLREQPLSHGKVAVVGYCFGGTYTFALATADPDLVAAVPYYGHATDNIDELQAIRCPVLAFYGEEDSRLMQELPKLKQQMQEAGVSFRAAVYPHTGHAFFNDTNPTAYRPEAAQDAWGQTLAFLAEQFTRR